MKQDKKLLCIILSLIMILCFAPTVVFADTANASVSTFAQLQTALNNAPTDGTQYVIELTADFDITAALSIGNGKNILIRSDSTKRTLTRGATGIYLFNLGAAVATPSTLTLENIIIDGAKTTYSANTRSLIYVQNANALHLGSGAVLQNNKASGNGGAVNLVAAAATFSMNGATVQNNEALNGGGIYVSTSVTTAITITDSVITGNTAVTTGGGIYLPNTNLTVNGSSKITNNTATYGGGIAIPTTLGGNTISIAGSTEITGNNATNRGGGIYTRVNTATLPAITLNISDTAKLQDNTAPAGGGMYTDVTNVTVSTVTPISGNVSTTSSGSALYVNNGDLTLESGVSVTENISTLGNGYAVYVINGKLTMKSGSSVTNNGSVAKPCGGVYVNTGATYVNPGSIDMQSGSVVSGNYGVGGAGVYLKGAGGTIAGKISGNTSSDNGGGLYFHGGTIASGGTAPVLYIVDGAEITNNTAACAGGGIYVNGDKAPDTTYLRGILYVQGGTISGNTANGTDATGKDSGGGGIAVARGQAVISGGTITGNTAVLGAGGVQAAKQDATYIGSGIVTITGGTISGNTGSPANLGIQSVLYGEIIIDCEFTNSQDMIIDTSSTLTINSNKTITGSAKISLPVISGQNSYLVTINPKGGEFTLSSSSVSGSSITLGTVTKSGYSFNGWSDGTNTYNANSSITITADTTLSAIASVTSGVGGRVTDGINGVDSATVQIQHGDRIVATTTTNANGYYLFANIPSDAYNLVVTKNGATKTVLLEVVSSSTTVDDIVITSATKQSIVEVKAETPSIAVDGVDDIAQSQSETDVIIKISLEQQTDTSTTPQESIKALSRGSTFVFIDILLTKQVGAGNPVDVGDSNNTVLELIIPFDFFNIGNVRIFRYHNNVATAFTKINARALENARTDGTYYLDVDNGKIYVYASKYSTYAVGYDIISPQTGDNNFICLYIGLLILSTLILIAAYKRRSAKYFCSK